LSLVAVCKQFSRGVFSMLGAVNPDSFDTLHSYSNTFKMPFVTPWFPEKVSHSATAHAHSAATDYLIQFLTQLSSSEPGYSVTIVSDYGLVDRGSILGRSKEDFFSNICV
jgi:hypothetical protein